MEIKKHNAFEGLENLNKVEFIEPKLSLEETILRKMNQNGLKIQSVCLPLNFKHKTEADILNWLKNNVKSLHSANYEVRLKYEIKEKIKLKYNAD